MTFTGQVPGISLKCPPPKRLELLDVTSSDAGEVQNPPVPLPLSELRTFRDKEMTRPWRNSFSSWTDYAMDDPAAAPNRMAHEISNDQVMDFVSNVHEAPDAFQRYIRRKRGEPDGAFEILWALFGCGNLPAFSR